MRINFDVEKHTFASRLSQEVATGGLTVIDAIERLLGEWLEGPITRSLGNRLIKAPRAVVHPHYCVDRFQNLSNLSREGYLIWYPEVRFSTPISDAVAINQVEMTGFELGGIQYGFGIERQYTYKRNELKTQVNHTLRLNKVTIPADVFQQTLSGLKQIDEISQPYIANLTVGCERFVDERIEGFRTVAFDHVMTGERRFCSYHAHAHAAMLTEARALAPRYVEDSWPQRVVRLLENVIYSDGICHFCVAEQHGPDTPMEWYGGQIRELCCFRLVTIWVTSLGLAGEAGIFASLPFYPMFSGVPNGPLRLSPPQVHAAVHNSGRKALDRWPIGKGQNSTKLRTLAEE